MWVVVVYATCIAKGTSRAARLSVSAFDLAPKLLSAALLLILGYLTLTETLYEYTSAVGFACLSNH